MGIDYSAASGWGFWISLDELEKCLGIDRAEGDDWSETLDERSPVTYETFGSNYSGELWVAFADPDPSVMPEKMSEINTALGTKFTEKDFDFISEVLVW